MVKNLPSMWETGFNSSIGKMPWRRARQPTSVFLPENPHGQRSLAGPWGCKESDMMERLSTAHFRGKRGQQSVKLSIVLLALLKLLWQEYQCISWLEKHFFACG